MARSTRKETKTTKEQSVTEQTLWLLMQMGIVVNDIANMKKQINILREKRSCSHEAIVRNDDACRTPPRPTTTGRAPRSRSPRTPPTRPPRTRSPLEPLTPLSLPAPTPLSPLSPLDSISVTELLELLGPDVDIDLEIERIRYDKS